MLHAAIVQWGTNYMLSYGIFVMNWNRSFNYDT
jgi:hypothetical protein